MNVYEVNPCHTCTIKNGYGGDERCLHCELRRLRKEVIALRKKVNAFKDKLEDKMCVAKGEQINGKEN